MSGNVDIERAQREEARWRILYAINSGRPGPVSETILLRMLQDNELGLSPIGLRRELDYLEERLLVKVNSVNKQVWTAELTRIGMDVVEYTVECDPGIARPPKWY